MIQPYPDSRIGYGETNRCHASSLTIKCRIERYFSALGELNGIGDEIGQYLAQAGGIAFQELRNLRRDARVDAEALRASLDAQKLDDFFDGLTQVEASIFDDDLARLDLRKVQDVGNEGQHSPSASQGHSGVSPLLGSELCSE